MGFSPEEVSPDVAPELPRCWDLQLTTFGVDKAFFSTDVLVPPSIVPGSFVCGKKAILVLNPQGKALIAPRTTVRETWLKALRYRLISGISIPELDQS